MNQDGNTAMPQNPSFSSPNSDTPPTNPAEQPAQPIMSTPDDAPVAQPIMSTPDDEPTPEAPAPSVATTAAAMPDNGATGAITSAPESNSSRGLFTNRRFSKKQQPAAPTTFAGAPDFFNQAAAQSNDYITIGEEPKATDPGTKKRLIILGAIVGVAAVIAIVGAVIMPAISQNAAKNEVVKAWNKIGNLIIYGEEKEDDLPEERPAGTETYLGRIGIKREDGYYDGVLNKLTDYEKKYISDTQDDYGMSTIKEMQKIVKQITVAHKARGISDIDYIFSKERISEDDFFNSLKDRVGFKNISEDRFSRTVSDYLAARVSVSVLYDRYDCFKEDGTFEPGCIGGKVAKDGAYTTAINNKEKIDRDLRYLMAGLCDKIVSFTYEYKGDIK